MLTKHCCPCLHHDASPSTVPRMYMVKMKQEAQNRKRRLMHQMRPTGTGGAAEAIFARMAKGEMDEEDYLTDDEQLDVLPG